MRACVTPLEQLATRLVLVDIKDATGEHGARVHAHVHLHEAHAGLRVAAHHRPLNGRSPAPAR
jgi:hypothetical protein